VKTRKAKNDQVEASIEVTVRQAGSRGGCRTLELHGREFFSEIGRRGGQRTAELYRELLGEFGRRGGRPRRPTLDESMGEEGH